MYRLLLYPFVVCRFVMNCFTCSGWFRSACLLMYVKILSTVFMLLSFLFSFFIFISMFRIGVGCGKSPMGLYPHPAC